MIFLFELTKFLIFIILIFFENLSKDFLTSIIKSFCPFEFRYEDIFLKAPLQRSLMHPLHFYLERSPVIYSYLFGLSSVFILS
jgi:hypothetical protein